MLLHILTNFYDAIEFHLSIYLINHIQGQFVEAESLFCMMKEAGYSPDNIACTTMLHAYSAAGTNLLIKHSILYTEFTWLSFSYIFY